jgi:hypothetical protein
MTSDKKLEGPDPDALEFQIEKMIDELFVSKEEPSQPQTQPPSGSASATPSRLEPTFTLAEEVPAAPVEDFGLGPEERPGVLQNEEILAPEEQLVFHLPTETGLSDAKPQVLPSAGLGGADRPPENAPDKTAFQGGNDDFLAGFKSSSDTAFANLFESTVKEQSAAPTLEAEIGGFQMPVADLRQSREPASSQVGPDLAAQRLCNSLKENILSLEWEISPQNISRFLEAMQPLQEHLSGNASAVKAAMMMNSVLSYIKKVGRSALPLSIQVLQSGVEFLSAVLLPDKSVDAEKHRDLFASVVDQYKFLKYQIEQQREKVPRPKARASVPRQPVSPELAEHIRSTVDEAVRSFLETTLQEELQKFRQQITEMITQETHPAAMPKAPVDQPSTAEEMVLTVTMGDSHYNIPKSLVANIYSPSKRKLDKISQSEAFGIKDLVSPFSSITKGLMGPLTSVASGELKNQRFTLVDISQSLKIPRTVHAQQLVLISDGNRSYGFLADAARWRTAEIPVGFVENMIQEADSSADFFQASPKEYPFLNVVKLL